MVQYYCWCCCCLCVAVAVNVVDRGVVVHSDSVDAVAAAVFAATSAVAISLL